MKSSSPFQRTSQDLRTLRHFPNQIVLHLWFLYPQFVNLPKLVSRFNIVILKRTAIFAPIMGYAKERGKLEKLLSGIAGISTVNEKNLAVLVDGHQKYSHTVRILKNKN